MSLTMLRVRGDRIVDEGGAKVSLRGVCLGGWLNMESFITGYPGSESQLRAAVAAELGPELAAHFFERFLHYFVQEDDLRYLAELGCTVVRLPFNYRHLERDDAPFSYREEGLAYLDRAIAWAKAHGVYVILDLHATPGWQNRGWHSDNPQRQAHLWGNRHYEERTVALWQMLARRYASEPAVAGYNLINEPDAENVAHLNRLYRELTGAIRAIDPDHIIFLEGNRTSQEFETLDPPFDDNTVYSSHNYVEPTFAAPYPGLIDGERYDRARLQRDYRARASFMLRHGVPSWVGEFGSAYGDPALTDSHLQVVDDMMGIIEAHGHHWTHWTYKDIGLMGLVCVDPDSAWMRRTATVRRAKTALRCDWWVERVPSAVDRQLDEIVAVAVEALDGLDGGLLRLRLAEAVQETALSQALLPAFAAQFRGMDHEQIDELMQSFALGRCRPRQGLQELMRRHLTSR